MTMLASISAKHLNPLQIVPSARLPLTLQEDTTTNTLPLVTGGTMKGSTFVG
jgi:hypothetical protein